MKDELQGIRGRGSREGPKVASGSGAHSCPLRRGSCLAPEACGQEVSPVTATLQLGAGRAYAGEQGRCKGDQPAVGAPRVPSYGSGLNEGEALGEGTLPEVHRIPPSLLVSKPHICVRHDKT